MRQRSLREDDVEFILRHGTETDDGVLLTARDVQELVRGAKRLIETAERLRCKRVATRDGAIITAFHADRRQQHALLHR
jgi:hypothetical protein